MRSNTFICHTNKSFGFWNYQQNNIGSNVTSYRNLSEYNNEEYIWEVVFQDHRLVPIISKPLVIFGSIKVISNTKTLVLDHVILMYIPRILDEVTHKRTPQSAKIYYEEAHLYKNIRKTKAQIL